VRFAVPSPNSLLLKRWGEKEIHIAHALYLEKSWLEEKEEVEGVGEGRRLAKMDEGRKDEYKPLIYPLPCD
jgi:hypothetical protein